ncbi:MAG: XRE family transcriptional regulator [Rhizobiales bacterium NRL2]|nr:MAG: XRE family transcriptional regulator [Rhizobiales bacterium NRL2]
MAEHPHPVDIYVGSRIRLCRTLKGMSQQKLAEALKLTFQQIQKYEKGTNRVGASRLFEMSHILDVPVSFFFDGAPVADAAETEGPDVDENAIPAEDAEKLFRREILEFIRVYDRIPEPAVRQRLYALAKTLARPE